MAEPTTIQPPEAMIQLPDEVQSQVPATIEWARALVVLTHGDFDAAADRLKGIKALAKQITNLFTPLKRSADAHKRAILDAEHKLLGPLGDSEDLAKSAMLTFVRAESERREAQQRALQARVDEDARKAREKLESQAATAKKPETVERKLAEAAAIQAPVIAVPPPPKTQGVTVKQRWTFTVENEAEVPREFLIVDEVKLGRYATAMREGAKVAGVRFYTDDSMAVSV